MNKRLSDKGTQHSCIGMQLTSPTLESPGNIPDDRERKREGEWDLKGKGWLSAELKDINFMN